VADAAGTKPRVWVPIALPEDEARAAVNAMRTVFASLTALGKASEAPELARAMYATARALDRALEEAGDA
jgi:hypothetical protein